MNDRGVTQPGLRERKKQQTRRLLADTARQLFADRGFDAVTVAEIAHAANVSEPTVFNYFPRRKTSFSADSKASRTRRAYRDLGKAPGQGVFDAFATFVGEPRGLLAAGDKNRYATTRDLADEVAKPALLAREQQILARYTAALTDLIANETGAGADDPGPRSPLPP